MARRVFPSRASGPRVGGATTPTEWGVGWRANPCFPAIRAIPHPPPSTSPPPGPGTPLGVSGPAAAVGNDVSASLSLHPLHPFRPTAILRIPNPPFGGFDLTCEKNPPCPPATETPLAHNPWRWGSLRILRIIARHRCDTWARPVLTPNKQHFVMCHDAGFRKLISNVRTGIEARAINLLTSGGAAQFFLGGSTN